jgi:YVTN family beta-propeller protein
MKKSLIFFIISTFSFAGHAQSLQQLESKRVKLSNGWSLTPAGSSLPLGDLPLNMVVSPSSHLMAVTNNGYSDHSVQLIDLRTNKELDNVVVPKAWYGLKFTADEKSLFVGGGNDNWILKYNISNNKLQLADSFKLGAKWPERISPAGIDIDEQKKVLYVVTKENNSLYTIDLTTRKIIWQYQLEGDSYACQLSPDHKKLFISCWGCDKLICFDTEKERIVEQLALGDNPNEILQTKNGQYLYVANSNDNSVSVVDTKKWKVIETLDAALYPNAPSGSTSNGLALSPDEKTLYVANADNNCLAVFDVSHPGLSKSKGFIPTGWYPTSVKVVGNIIYVANGKGFSSMANPYGPNPGRRNEEVLYQGGDPTKPFKVQYIAGLFKGTLSMIPIPSVQQLSVYSQAVYHNTPYNKDESWKAAGEPGNPVPMKIGDPSPVKYVFYIIKENRTYDQVLGDIKKGNGDPSLVLFGEKITPNLHKIANDFVLLDNFYCDGEVSADGHNWSMGAYATDYLEKTWPSRYGNKGGVYSAEGNRSVANNKDGFIWDHCNRDKISFRSYGEFCDNYKPNIPVLRDHYCPFFTGWDLSTRDTVRYSQWKRDFDSLLAINAVPHFNSVRFGNDHTEGLRKGRPTPSAFVADNDLAVGLFLEHLSESPIWKETAVFIIEDDAQNGADHVDAHRTSAYIAGGFVKRSFVDHTMYSTSSMLRTMELILGMEPMTQYDAAAMPMWNCFTTSPDLHPFHHLPSNVDLDDRNVAVNEWQKRSEKFDFAKEDAIPDMEFNYVLWFGLKGDKVPYPAPRRAAFLKLNEGKKDNE